jgi:hypothetical protein
MVAPIESFLIVSTSGVASVVWIVDSIGIFYQVFTGTASPHLWVSKADFLVFNNCRSAGTRFIATLEVA